MVCFSAQELKSHPTQINLQVKREFIFIKYIKKVQQMDYPDNGLKAQGLLAQDRISAGRPAPIVSSGLIS